VTSEPAPAGYFYVVQLAPDVAPGRVKLGWAIDPARRLTHHRCAAPTATLVATWPCHRDWEKAAITAIATGSSMVSGEVFDVADVSIVTAIASAFFATNSACSPRNAPRNGPIVNHLSRLLGERRMSIAELQRQTGLSYVTLHDLYSDKTERVALRTLDKICRALDVTPGDIFGYRPDPSP
jgi:putative transcriptional regulator